MHKTSALISLKHACVADTSYGKIWTFLSCGKRDWEEHRNKLSQISRLSFLNQYRPKKQWGWNMTMHKDYSFSLSRRRKFSPMFLFCFVCWPKIGNNTLETLERWRESICWTSHKENKTWHYKPRTRPRQDEQMTRKGRLFNKAK